MTCTRTIFSSFETKVRGWKGVDMSYLEAVDVVETVQSRMVEIGTQ